MLSARTGELAGAAVSTRDGASRRGDGVLLCQSLAQRLAVAAAATAAATGVACVAAAAGCFGSIGVDRSGGGRFGGFGPDDFLLHGVADMHPGRFGASSVFFKNWCLGALVLGS